MADHSRGNTRDVVGFRYACRHCGHAILRGAVGWVHVDDDAKPLHARCRLASRLRAGRPDDRLPKTATATPRSGRKP